MQIHFQNHTYIIEQALRQARKEIKIAVCWLTHPGIFETVLQQLRRGFPVRHFYGYTLPELMHHKFCIIDQQLLINGSFNWTQNNNRENILLTKQPEVVQAFLLEFETLRAASRHFKQIDYGLVKTFQTLHLLDTAEYSEQALRKKITQGAQVWIYHAGKDKTIRDEMSPAGVIGFKNKVLMTRYWAKSRYFEKDNFLDIIKHSEVSAIEKAASRAWCLRLKAGDIVVGCDRRKQSVISIGIVQSAPFLFGLYTGRQVAWIKDFSQAPLVSGFKIPSAGLSLYKGSSLELVARICS